MTPLQQEQNNQEILACFAEARAINAKKHITRQDARRHDELLARISYLKAGHGLDEVLQCQHNEHERRNGLSVTAFRRTASSNTPEERVESRMITRWMQTGDLEARTETVGVPVYANLNGNVGSLVPVNFFGKIVRAMRQHSPLFDPENVTYLESVGGNPVQVPFISDVENFATVLSENADDSGDTDINAVGGKHVLTYNYRTPRMKFSYEAGEDVDITPLLRDVMTERLAVGAGIDLISGDGSNKPLGLVPSVTALGAIVTAAGSAANDGSANTGADSIGARDLANLFFSVPKPYRKSPKFAFLMNSQTALFISQLTDKMGRPLLDLDDELVLFGKQVLVDESMDDIGPSKVPVLAGDLSYWCTRVATGNMYLNRSTEGPGLVENGVYAVTLFGRVGGAFLFSDVDAPSPVWALQNHS